jgi:hypothetical protein
MIAMIAQFLGPWQGVDGRSDLPVGQSGKSFFPDMLRACGSQARNSLRVKSNFASGVKLIWVVSSPGKNISLSENKKLWFLPVVPSSQEGRFAVVTDVESGMRWTLAASGAQAPRR